MVENTEDNFFTAEQQFSSELENLRLLSVTDLKGAKWLTEHPGSYNIILATLEDLPEIPKELKIIFSKAVPLNGHLQLCKDTEKASQVVYKKPPYVLGIGLYYASAALPDLPKLTVHTPQRGSTAMDYTNAGLERYPASANPETLMRVVTNSLGKLTECNPRLKLKLTVK